MTELQRMGKLAKEAAGKLASAGSLKDTALLSMAKALEEGEEQILRANEKDLEAARQAGMRPSLLDRLALNHSRIAAMAEGIRQVAAQQDPIGEILEGSVRPNGMRIRRVRVPLGVVGIIYEARPNVTADAAALCLKAGNAVILRGGKEAIRSNCAILDVMAAAAEKAGLPKGSLQLVRDTSRESAREMMGLTGYLDVLIPRGGAGLIRAVVEGAKVPVIETGVGNCHLYIDESADETMAVEIAYNGKTSRPSVCNALEKVLVHEGVTASVLPRLAQRLSEKNVEFRCCERSLSILREAGFEAVPASEEDWDTEYLDYILGIRVVKDIEEALFTERVDSAAVYVNCSTRFTDGGEFGLGAEIGISTQKLHARGPMGVRELTSSKFIIEGSGQIR